MKVERFKLKLENFLLKYSKISFLTKSVISKKEIDSQTGIHYTLGDSEGYPGERVRIIL